MGEDWYIGFPDYHLPKATRNGIQVSSSGHQAHAYAETKEAAVSLGQGTPTLDDGGLVKSDFPTSPDSASPLATKDLECVGIRGKHISTRALTECQVPSVIDDLGMYERKKGWPHVCRDNQHQQYHLPNYFGKPPSIDTPRFGRSTEPFVKSIWLRIFVQNSFKQNENKKQ